MHFTAIVTGLLALGSFAAAAPKEHSKQSKQSKNDNNQPVPVPTGQDPNAGSGGNGVTNLCDDRSNPELEKGPASARPKISSCLHLAELLGNGSIFGNYTKVGSDPRSFTSGDCQITLLGPVFDNGSEEGYWVGSSDLRDLVDSAIEDFEKDDKVVSTTRNRKYAVGEQNVVTCQEVGGEHNQIIVKYSVGKPVSGNTLPKKPKNKKSHQ